MQDFLEFVRRIRSESSDWDKAYRYARGFGWICLGVGAWNLLCQFLYTAMPMPEQVRNMFRHPALLSSVALVALAGVVALGASRGLRNREPLGVQLAKLGLAIFAGGIVSFLAFFWLVDTILPVGGIGGFFRVFMVLVGGQFLIPVWFAFGYLDRLDLGPERTLPDDSVQDAERMAGIFREGLTELGPGAMMMGSLLVAVLPGVVLFLFEAAPERLPFVFFLALFVAFAGAWGWNEIPSSFQKTREVLASYRTGISLPFFNASAPFCKLLVYRDGLEVRIEFNRFFVPFDRMEHVPRLEGFLWVKKIAIRCDLPGVPRKIEIQPFFNDDVLESIRSAMDGNRK